MKVIPKLGWRDAVIAVAIAVLWVCLVRPGPVGLPYFWDEADVYVPGALWLSENGLNATPGVFPDDYSRGHPPLLYLIAGTAFLLFGSSPVVGHLVVLPFTVAALAGTYLLGATVFGRVPGVVAAIGLALTPLFMSIGNMLLPEVPLTAFAVLSLLAAVNRRLGWAALAGSFAVLTKETGVFGVGAVGLYVLWDTRGRWRSAWRSIALASSPLVVLAGFFVWQKVYAGYFVFPHHQNLLWERPFGWSDLWTAVPSILGWHGRWFLVGAAICAVPWAVGRRGDPRAGALLTAGVGMVIVNILFFAKMFWLERYALPVHPVVLVLAAGALASPRWLALAILPTAALGSLGLRAPTEQDTEEHTFAYADVVRTHQQAIGAIIVRGGDPLVLTPWPMTVELQFPYLGYTTFPVRTSHPDWPKGGADLILVPDRSRHSVALRETAERAGMRSVGRWKVGSAPALELFAP